MKITAQEFKQLQTEWYKKLRESGFEDIENNPAKQYRYKSVRTPWIGIKSENCQKRLDYFHDIAQKINDPDTQYRDEADYLIMTWHCEGYTTKKIIESLKEMGICKHRNTVRNRIHRYLWKWHFRPHPPKYLRLPIQS